MSLADLECTVLMDVLLALSTQISTVILNNKPQPFGFCTGHIFCPFFPSGTF